jgi:hypothetical protein
LKPLELVQLLELILEEDRKKPFSLRFWNFYLDNVVLMEKKFLAEEQIVCIMLQQPIPLI